MRWVLALVCVLAPASELAAEPKVSPILYLNRCRGGCTVRSGVDDARAMTSSIPKGNASGEYMIEEFRNADGEIGEAADAEWAEILHCVRELYSPYAIEVTDEVPPGGLSHNQGIVAGRPINIGWTGIGGVAPGTPGCDPRDNVISFTFANIYGGPDRVINVCAVVGQETAHAYGLDHAFEFSDGRSACPDPMSYRNECGGQRFFRNDNATCGEYMPRGCYCGGFQNSHKRLLAIFGPGTPITQSPEVTINTPEAGTTVGNGATVVATASAQRGVARLELWLNGYNWLTVKGAPFTSTGQPETSYPLTFPPDVPDGVIDIVVKAFDDIDVMTETAPVTVTKGAPCADASTCAEGQQCADGRCYWAPPTGQIGDACEYSQFCESGHCVDTTDGDSVCSEECVVNVADSCPMGFSCVGTAGQTGFCLAESGDKVGCCNIGADGRAASLLALAVFGLLLRRR